MNYLVLRNMKQVSCCKFFYSALMRQQCSVFKVTYHLGSSNFSPSRNISWTGFYSALSQSTPVISLQNLLIELHQVSGLPWWTVILLTTLGIRSLIVFPLTVHQNQVISRLANINAGMGNVAAELNKEVNIARRMYNWDEDTAKKVFRRQLKKIHKDYVVRDNCHPFKTALLVLIQVPAWVCFSVSLRNITMISNSCSPDLNLKMEGSLWFTDLTCPDPIFIPLLLMVVNLSLIEIHALRRIGKGSMFQKVLLNGSRIITVVIAVAATFNPASVTFYWLCSSTFGIGQSVLLMVPRVRQVLRIPRTGKESATPFADIAKNFKNRFIRLK